MRFGRVVSCAFALSVRAGSHEYGGIVAAPLTVFSACSAVVCVFCCS